jgi:protein-S-isoprenylcysteine O-methyltransferase Ste14
VVKAKMAVISVVSTAAFLGLAIAAAGGISVLLADGPFIALTVVTIVFLVAALFTRASLSSGVREDRSNRWVVAALSVLGIAIAILPPLCWRYAWLLIGGGSVRWIGVSLYALGGVLRLGPVFVLGNRFSGLVAIQSNHRLVTTGIYARIRHPSYLGALTLSLGWALAFASLIGVAIVVLMLIPLAARMNAEEKLLTDEFGEKYQSYCARTARLVPGVY